MYIKKNEIIDIFKLWKKKVDENPNEFYTHEEFESIDEYGKKAYKNFKTLLKEVQDGKN